MGRRKVKKQRDEVMWYAAGLSEYQSKRVCYVTRIDGIYAYTREEPETGLYAIFFDGYLAWCEDGDSQNYFSKRRQSLMEVRREVQAALRGHGKRRKHATVSPDVGG